MDSTAEVFLLTRDARDTPRGLELVLWASGPDGPVRVVLRDQEAVCFVARASASPPGVRRREVALATLDGTPVDALYFRSRRALEAFRERPEPEVHESDVRPADRFLMERFVTGPMVLHGRAEPREGFVEYVDPRVRAGEGRPRLHAVSLDIETSGLDGDDRGQQLWSIAVSGAATRPGPEPAAPGEGPAPGAGDGIGDGSGPGTGEGGSAGDEPAEAVFLVDPGADPAAGPSFLRHPAGGDAAPVHLLSDEAAVLRAFLAWVADYDPDLVIGWNVTGFDLRFLEARCRLHGIEFALGRDRGRARVLDGAVATARVPGGWCWTASRVTAPRSGDSRTRASGRWRARFSAATSSLRQIGTASTRFASSTRPTGSPSPPTTSRTAVSYGRSSTTPASSTSWSSGAGSRGSPSAGRGIRRRLRPPLPAAPASARAGRAGHRRRPRRRRREPGRPRPRLAPGALSERRPARLQEPVSEHHPHLPHRPPRPRRTGPRPGAGVRRRGLRARGRDTARPHRRSLGAPGRSEAKRGRAVPARGQDPDELVLRGARRPRVPLLRSAAREQHHDARARDHPAQQDVHRGRGLRGDLRGYRLALRAARRPPRGAGGRGRARGAVERVVARDPRRGAPPGIVSRGRVREPVRALPHADLAGRGEGHEKAIRGARAERRRSGAGDRLQGARDGADGLDAARPAVPARALSEGVPRRTLRGLRAGHLRRAPRGRARRGARVPEAAPPASTRTRATFRPTSRRPGGSRVRGPG